MESIVRANTALEPSELPGCSDLMIYSSLRQQCELRGLGKAMRPSICGFHLCLKSDHFSGNIFKWEGRGKKKSISNGFNIEKVIFRFQAPLSSDGSLPRLDNIMYPAGNGQWERW